MMTNKSGKTIQCKLYMLLPTVLSLLLIGHIDALAHSDDIEFHLYIVKNSVNKLNSDFIDILFENSTSEKNFLFSPLNIYSALAMVHLGASGTTKKELSIVLGPHFEESKLTEAHETLGKVLDEIYKSSDELNIANGIFIQDGLKLKDTYKESTLKYYKSKTQQVDFENRGSDATNIVNQWIDNTTKHHIPKLFDDEIPSDTVLLLVNALYFAGKWTKSFDMNNTEIKDFNTGVKLVQVPIMSATEEVHYINHEVFKFEAISIPMGKNFSMLITLPYEDQSLKNLITSLKAVQISELIDFLAHTEVNYKIPRFNFHWSQNIDRYLDKLGIKLVFDEYHAELDNMADSKNLFLSKVIHAAEIEIDEKGSVASAVTITKAQRRRRSVSQITQFYVDRPFLFSIYHQSTSGESVVLFTGAVQNPADTGA